MWQSLFGGTLAPVVAIVICLAAAAGVVGWSNWRRGD